MAASACRRSFRCGTILLALQRGMAQTNNVVMDGRDVGTAILPNAQVKIFLTASSAERAQRRWKSCAPSGETGCPTPRCWQTWKNGIGMTLTVRCAR